MKKKVKRNLKYFAIFLTIIFLIGLVYYFGVKEAFIIQDLRLFDIQQISSSSNSYTYQLQVRPSSPTSCNQVCSSDVKLELDVSETIVWYDFLDNFQESGQGINVELPSDIQYNKEFLIDSVKFSGLTVLSVYCDKGYSPTFTDTGSYCIAENKDKIRCVVKGKFSVDGKQFRSKPCGTNLISINVILLKQGIECLDNSYCDLNEICINNVCVETEIEKIYYRFSDNVCSEISLLESEKTSNDYETLSVCEENIEELSTPISEEETIEEEEEIIIVNKECEDNVDCIEICGDATPTCIDNLCYCDEVIYEEEEIKIIKVKSDINPLFYLIPIVLLIIIIYLVYNARRKK